jgi:two-component system, LytTR family, response regulator
MPFTCLIADDEDLALALLEQYIAALPELQLIAKCFNGREVLEAVKQQMPDIVFLDIQMPYTDGLQLAEVLAPDAAVIFTTAYSEFAIESYRLNAVDYLLKPFLSERFEQAAAKAVEYIRYKRNKAAADAHLFVKSGGRVIKILLDDILFFEGRKQYVKIYLQQESLMVLDSMKNFEDSLPAEKFMRIHKSYIVARDKISGIGISDVSIGTHLLPVGKTYKKLIAGWRG